MNSTPRPRILVVDDAPENISLVTQILSREFDVLAATSGTEALRVADRDPRPDLVLLDVVMPGMDGFAVCRALKQAERTRTIPVIFVTGSGDDRSEEKGFEAGGADFVTKPVNPVLVLARARAHIQLHRALEELRAQNEALQEAIRMRELMEAVGRHDLKSPLTVVINAPKILSLDGSVRDEQRVQLQAIESAGRRMLSIINQTIDLYRMENGSYGATDRQEVDPFALIDEIRADLNPIWQPRGIHWVMLVGGKTRSATTRCIVHADETLLFCALQNILKNAIEASGPGQELVVEVKEPDVDPPNGGTIEITNSGGIPAHLRETFFEKYHGSTKSGGSGLGAYSARLMARTMGGDVTLVNAGPDRTTIRVTLG